MNHPLKSRSRLLELLVAAVLLDFSQLEQVREDPEDPVRLARAERDTRPVVTRWPWLARQVYGPNTRGGSRVGARLEVADEDAVGELTPG